MRICHPHTLPLPGPALLTAGTTIGRRRPDVCEGREHTVNTTPEPPVVHKEVAELRRSCDVAQARVDGGLALLGHRAEETAKELDALAARVTALERNRWPLRAVATLASVGALALALWQALAR